MNEQWKELLQTLNLEDQQHFKIPGIKPLNLNLQQIQTENIPEITTTNNTYVFGGVSITYTINEVVGKTLSFTLELPDPLGNEVTINGERIYESEATFNSIKMTSPIIIYCSLGLPITLRDLREVISSTGEDIVAYAKEDKPNEIFSAITNQPLDIASEQVMLLRELVKSFAFTSSTLPATFSTELLVTTKAFNGNEIDAYNIPDYDIIPYIFTNGTSGLYFDLGIQKYRTSTLTDNAYIYFNYPARGVLTYNNFNEEKSIITINSKKYIVSDNTAVINFEVPGEGMIRFPANSIITFDSLFFKEYDFNLEQSFPGRYVDNIITTPYGIIDLNNNTVNLNASLKVDEIEIISLEEQASLTTQDYEYLKNDIYAGIVPIIPSNYSITAKQTSLLLILKSLGYDIIAGNPYNEIYAFKDIENPKQELRVVGKVWQSSKSAISQSTGYPIGGERIIVDFAPLQNTNNFTYINLRETTENELAFGFFNVYKK